MWSCLIDSNSTLAAKTIAHLVALAQNVKARLVCAMCAGEGQPMSLVVTDVEGSTELWEWNHNVMMQGQALHDQIMRKHLRKFHGYEVYTEGDAFCLAFHTPADALAWCAVTQQVRAHMLGLLSVGICYASTRSYAWHEQPAYGATHFLVSMYACTICSVAELQG